MSNPYNQDLLQALLLQQASAPSPPSASIDSSHNTASPQLAVSSLLLARLGEEQERPPRDVFVEERAPAALSPQVLLGALLSSQQQPHQTMPSQPLVLEELLHSLLQREQEEQERQVKRNLLALLLLRQSQNDDTGSPPSSSLMEDARTTTATVSSSSSHAGSSIPAPPSNTQKKPARKKANGDPDYYKNAKRFTDAHHSRWMERYKQLAKFVRENGHANVPIDSTQVEPALSHWVKRQRFQKKAKEANQSSTLTDDRQQLLEALGFVWDAHAASWEQHFHELRIYKDQYGDCNVPTRFPANQSLAIWVKCQRRQYSLATLGKTTHMTADRIGKLEGLGFVWKPRDR